MGTYTIPQSSINTATSRSTYTIPQSSINNSTIILPNSITGRPIVSNTSPYLENVMESSSEQILSVASEFLPVSTNQIVFKENEVISQEGTFEQERRESRQHHNTVQQNEIIYDIQY